MESDKTDLRVVEIRRTDVMRANQSVRDLRALVSRSSDSYPTIHSWIDERVLPELALSRRKAFVGYEGSRPTVSAVVKRSPMAKFCHLRVSESLRSAHVGELFFALMALEVRHVARSIHFTLGESVWERHKRFFQSFGFQSGQRARVQYRPRETELVCSASFRAVWTAVLEKLPKLASQFSSGGYSLSPALLIAVKPEFAQEILNGTKTIEIRRRFSDKWIGHRVSLYASNPIGGLIGEATVNDVVSDTPENIWKFFSTQIGCTKRNFDLYSRNLNRVFAVRLEGVRPYVSEVPRAQAARLVGVHLAAPQSYQRLHASDPWGRAVSVAALLHGPLRAGAPKAEVTGSGQVPR